MKIIQFPLARFILSFIFGIAISQKFEFSFAAILCLNITLLFGILLSHLYSTKKKSHPLTFEILLCLFAITFGTTVEKTHDQRMQKTHYSHFEYAYQKPHKIQLTIREKLKSNEYSDKYIAILNAIDSNKISGKIILKIKKEAKVDTLETGNILFIKKQLATIPKPKNPNQFDYATYLENKNIFAQISCLNNEILKTKKYHKDIWYYSARIRSKIINQFLNKGIEKQQLNVATAILLGQRQDLNPELVKDYQYAGATHLLAVSGLHVGFIMLFLNFFLNKLSSTNRYNLFKLLVLISSLAFYAILTGLSPSILRATIMFSFIAIAEYLRRTTNIYYTLLVSAFFILLFDPNSLFDVGFQLSYTAVFFIVWMQPLFKKLVNPKNIIIRKIWDITTVSLAAQLGTLPLTLYYFHQFPSLFLVTNLIIIPLVSIIMFVGIFAMLFASVGFLPSILASILNYLLHTLNALISWIASFEKFTFQNIPYSINLLLCSFVFVISFVYFLKRKSYSNLIKLIIAIILLQFVFIYQKIENKNNDELVIYNVPKQTIISIKQGTKIIFYSNTKINRNDWNIRDYIISKNVSIEDKKIKNFLYYKNQKITIIDSARTYLKNNKPDILIIRQSPKINLERVLEELKPKIVIADASNYKTMIALWRKTCKSKKIPFHATYDMGYFKTY